MSLISRIFNRKGQDTSNQSKEQLYGIEEDFLEEDLPDEDPALIEEENLLVQNEEDSNEDDDEVYEVLERDIYPAKIICPDCGGITLEGLELCDKCGGELIQ